MGKRVEDANVDRVGQPLVQQVLARGKAQLTPIAQIGLQYTGSGKNIAVLEAVRGQSASRAGRSANGSV